MNKRPHNSPDEKETILKHHLSTRYRYPISAINITSTNRFLPLAERGFSNRAAAFIKIKSHLPKQPKKPISAREKKLLHQNKMLS